MRRNTTASFACLAVVFSSVCLAKPHSRLSAPAARLATDGTLQSILDGGGLNFDGPCGDPDSIPVGGASADLTLGGDFTMEVDHRIEHGGESYQFFLSQDGMEPFVEVLPPNQGLGGTVAYEAGGVANLGSGLHQIRVGVPSSLLPGPAVLRYSDGDYFSCADVSLTLEAGAVFSNGFESGDLSGWN